MRTYLHLQPLSNHTSSHGVHDILNGREIGGSRVNERYVLIRYSLHPYHFPYSSLLTSGIVWTIFFNRLFGPVTPTTNEFMDIAYPMAANLADLDSHIDSKIDELIKKDFGSSSNAAQPRVGQLVTRFLDTNATKAKKKSGWFGHVTEDKPGSLVWETWIVNVNCLPMGSADQTVPGDQTVNPAERMLQLSLLSFENALAEVMDLVDQHKAHIPPIMTLDVLPFPYEINIDPQSETVSVQPPAADDESWGHYIKKIID